MIVAGFCYYGKFKIKEVQVKPKLKASSLNHRQNILEPVFEEKKIPVLYGKDIDEVELHMDKASSQLPLI
ncbi:hypothetical protein TNCV_2581831 [Trichonephila clavipes]|nr:hypothetical protein TNCV_2581831 [Trichonephila clavipes]